MAASNIIYIYHIYIYIYISYIYACLVRADDSIYQVMSICVSYAFGQKSVSSVSSMCLFWTNIWPEICLKCVKYVSLLDEYLA
jgi:hypothetical protein